MFRKTHEVIDIIPPESEEGQAVFNERSVQLVTQNIMSQMLQEPELTPHEALRNFDEQQDYERDFLGTEAFHGSFHLDDLLRSHDAKERPQFIRKTETDWRATVKGYAALGVAAVAAIGALKYGPEAASDLIEEDNRNFQEQHYPDEDQRDFLEQQ